MSGQPAPGEDLGGWYHYDQEELGESKHVSLLNETLEEEKATDEKLTELAGDINAQANQGKEADAEEDTPPAKTWRSCIPTTFL